MKEAKRFWRSTIKLGENIKIYFSSLYISTKTRMAKLWKRLWCRTIEFVENLKIYLYSIPKSIGRKLYPFNSVTWGKIAIEKAFMRKQAIATIVRIEDILGFEFDKKQSIKIFDILVDGSVFGHKNYRDIQEYEDHIKGVVSTISSFSGLVLTDSQQKKIERILQRWFPSPPVYPS